MTIKGEVISDRQILVSKTSNKFNRFTNNDLKNKILNQEIEVNYNNYKVIGITFFIKNDDKILLDVYKAI